MAPDMHPDVSTLAFLLGTWRGDGKGEYPTIEAFSYVEEVTFGEAGKPFLTYGQRTWATDDGRPLHSETGYWRPAPNSGVEVILAHPFGITEIEIGVVTGQRVELMTHAIQGTPSAKRITRVERSFHVVEDVLTYDVRMAAVGLPVTHHLHAELRKAQAS